MKKLFTLLILTLLPLMASADAVEIDGIYYNLDAEEKTAEVTSNPNKYIDNIVVPASVTYEDVEYSVTSIGNNAFQYCWNLTGVTLPESIISIGNNAFNGCSSMESVVIPNSVAEINQSAFFSCRSLKSITIPSSVIYIDNTAFKNCSALEKIEVEEENEVYDSRDNCNAIIETETNFLVTVCKNTTLPEGIVSLEYAIFSNCDIASVIIPKSVTKINYGAFMSCPKLTSIQVAEGNEKYDSRENCNAIIETATNTLVLAPCSEFTIPASVTAIGSLAFTNSNGLTSIIIPKTITSVHPEAFMNNANLESIEIEEGNGIYDSRDHCNAVIETASNTLVAGCPATVIPSTVTTIGSWSFYNCNGLSSFTIPEGVQTIEESAFKNCSNLSSISFPSTLQKIESEAFNYCNKLTDIYCHATTPPTITELASTFPAGQITVHVLTSAVDSYTADDSWKQLGEIKGMTTSENNIVFEDALVKSICVKNWDTGGDGELSMEEAAAVTEFGNVFYNKRIKTFNEMQYFTNLKVIGPMAFHFSDVASIKFPTSLEEIGNGAFDETGLVSIDGGVTKNDFAFPDHIKILRWEAFAVNPGIHSVKIPASVTVIEPLCFRSCDNLTSFTIDEANTVYKMVDGWVIENGTKLVFSPLPQTIKSLIIPEGITEVAEYVGIYGVNGLEEVTLPSTIKKLARSAFNTMKKVTSNAIEPAEMEVLDEKWYPFNETTFNEATLYVPKGSKEKYEAADGWKNFKNIVEMGDEVADYKVGDEFTVDGMTYKVKNLEPLEVQIGTGSIPGESFSVGKPAIDTSTEGAITITSSVTGLDGNSYAVTAISAGAFSGCSGITSVVIPNSVTSISGGFDWAGYFGGGAFDNCGLTSLVIPSSVTSIGFGAFAGCGDLTSIVVDEGNTMYDSRDHCNAIISKTDNYLIAGCNKSFIADGVKGIGACAFKNCKGLSSLNLPNSVEFIGDAAFAGCSGLTSINLSTGLTSISTKAFEGCSGLTSIIIPEGVRYIWSESFSGCSSLTSVTLPKSLKDIGRDATSGIFSPTFDGCSSLTDVYCYAENAPDASANIFKNSNISNATLHVPVGCKETYAAADGWKDFKEIIEAVVENEVVYTPNEVEKTVTVQRSDDSAKEVEILPEVDIEGEKYEVTAISEGAFENNENLVKVSIPETITEIGNNAFAGCTGLKEIRIYAEEPIKLGTSTAAGTRGDGSNPVFSGVDMAECILYVPAGSKDKYAQAEGWKDFQNIVEMGAKVLIKISSAKQLPYCSDKDLDFTDKPELKAYVATGYDKATGTIWLTRVKDVPANTGFLIMGDAGDYDIPVKEGGSNAYYKNMFKGTIEATTIQTTETIDNKEYTNYYLSNGEQGVGFYKVTKAEGQSLNANRAYLPIPTEIPAVGTAGGTESIKVSGAGQVPYYSANSLDFTTLDNVKAYTATGYDYKSGTIWLTRVKKVPAETGILIMAPEGSYPIPTASVASIYENMFKGTLTETTIQTTETDDAGVDYINYYLSKGDYGVGFYKVKDEGVTLNPNRCYLPIPNQSAGTRGIDDDPANFSIQESDEVIGLRLFRSVDGTSGIESNNREPLTNNHWYNLHGQRVENPGKGIFIRNGKKVIIR